MSSLATSSPVSASTLRYLIRWPVRRFSWLNEIFSLSEVAGYSATGQVTSDRRRKPFQLARGAMRRELRVRDLIKDDRHSIVPTSKSHRSSLFLGNTASASGPMFLLCSIIRYPIDGEQFDVRAVSFCDCHGQLWR